MSKFPFPNLPGYWLSNWLESALTTLFQVLWLICAACPSVLPNSGPTWNSSWLEFLQVLNLQVGPRSGMIMRWGPTHPPPTRCYHIATLGPNLELKLTWVLASPQLASWATKWYDYAVGTATHPATHPPGASIFSTVRCLNRFSEVSSRSLAVV